MLSLLKNKAVHCRLPQDPSPVRDSSFWCLVMPCARRHSIASAGRITRAGGLFCWLGPFWDPLAVSSLMVTQVYKPQSISWAHAVEWRELSVAIQTISIRRGLTASAAPLSYSLCWVVLWSRGLLASAPISLHSSAFCNTSITAPPSHCCLAAWRTAATWTKVTRYWFSSLWGRTNTLPSLVTWKILV